MNPYEDIETRTITAKNIEGSADVLFFLLSGGFGVWKDGSLYRIKQLVDRIDGLRIEIYPLEHPPPHFHISGKGIDAMFSIADCSLLKGRIGGRERELVEWWYKRSRPLLVSAWNTSRPTNCSVGSTK